MISKDIPDSILQHYFDLIRLNADRYTLEDHRLIFHQSEKTNEKIRAYRQEIITELDSKIADLEQQRKVIEGKIVSAQQREERNTNQAEIDAYKKIRAKLITEIEEALRLAQEQANLLKQEERKPQQQEEKRPGGGKTYNPKKKSIA